MARQRLYKAFYTITTETYNFGEETREEIALILADSFSLAAIKAEDLPGKAHFEVKRNRDKIVISTKLKVLKAETDMYVYT